LSVDVEDYFHVEAFAGYVRPDTWDEFPARVVGNVSRLLELFARLEVRATFFVLGWVAERFPDLVRRIHTAGHELGCHSYAHQCIFRLTPNAFRDDTRRARAAIEDASGVRVKGYRAPSFSLVERSLWAVDILLEEGFTYDSSVFPITHDTYGMPNAPTTCFRWQSSGNLMLTELPMSTVKCGRINLPLGGGGYLRILPFTYTRWAANKVSAEGRPLQVYVHPWEIDPEQPRIKAGWKSRLRHYTNLRRTEERLSRLIQSYPFRPLIEVANAVEDSAPVVRIAGNSSHNSGVTFGVSQPSR
jgi:polysaccharide deacetylase family protein (PEP-CTERM system associated)